MAGGHTTDHSRRAGGYTAADLKPAVSIPNEAGVEIERAETSERDRSRALTARPRRRLPLDDVAVAARLLVSMPSLRRQRMSGQQARAILGHRLAHREADFLALAQRTIYQRPGSPYRQLLDLAGCEYGDL